MSTHPGAAIPHAWIQHDHQMISSHDVVGHGVFTVVTGIGGEPWQQAARTVGDELGIDVPVRVIGRHCEYDDVYGEWADVREITDHGALLVRPDHHVAWRSHELVDSPEDALRAALLHVLAR